MDIVVSFHFLFVCSCFLLVFCFKSCRTLFRKESSINKSMAILKVSIKTKELGKPKESKKIRSHYTWTKEKPPRGMPEI